jgi:hypothetical protein
MQAYDPIRRQRSRLDTRAIDNITSRRATLTLALALFVAGCPSTPEDCGKNVKRVVRIAFDGPAVLQTTSPGDQPGAGYTVTAVIEPQDSTQPAQICYAVRDDDPWTKLFWAVDDVLDANYIMFPVGETQRTFEGHFTLVEIDGEVCGWGAIPGDAKVKGCSDEDEAEVYLDVIGSDGASSATHSIRVP